MTKSNKFLLGIITLVVTLMIGYALFSETVTVTGTATAKGNFDITTTCITGLSSSLNVIAEGFPGTAGDVKNSTCSVNGSSVTFSTELGYPGSYQFYTLQFKNTGTIDALFANDSDIYEKYTGNIKVYLHSNNSLYKTVTLPSEDDFAINFSNVLFQASLLVKTDGTMIVGGDSETGRIVELSGVEYVKLKPNEVLEIAIIAIWPDNDNNHLKDYYAKTTFNQSFQFKQHTMEAVDKNDAYFCIGGC